ncbi:extracellular solute-binding protein [Dissulfurispira sp.]|uniref:extracellular solute-binding protein n=1 Tax=Dissulfurispira sp. TaxID=2817609 RepID=UPI002FD8F241
MYKISGVMKIFLAVVSMIVFFTTTGQVFAQELVIYSGRGERLIKPVLDEFTKKTGIKITLHSAGTVELLNKLLAEGDRTTADVYLTVDAGTLERARIAGLLQPIKSDIIEKNIPVAMRAPDNSWVGLSLRIRVIAYNPQKVKPEEVKTFDSLTDPKFKGRLGLRTGSNVYPQSHTAMMIAERGESETEKFLRAVLANAGDKIYPSDSRAVEAVAKGEVDAAIVNHYYVYGHLRKKPDDKKTLAFVVPPRTAYNVSGAGILKTSKNKEAAQKLIEFMASDEGQGMFSEENREYPVNPRLAPHADMMPRQRFTLSDVTLSQMGRYVVPAIDLIDKVGYR